LLNGSYVQELQVFGHKTDFLFYVSSHSSLAKSKARKSHETAGMRSENKNIKSFTVTLFIKNIVPKFSAESNLIASVIC